MGNYDGSSSRLDRIEEKIDKLSETVISLARAEEKLISLEKTNTSLMQSVIRLDERIDKVEEDTRGVVATYANIAKGIWSIVIGAVTAAVIAYFSSKG